jgi:4-amino-4-deoxy-L-arabinose transferase-like glycosyltransferase
MTQKSQYLLAGGMLILLSGAAVFGWIGDGSIGNNDDAIYSWAASEMVREDTWMSYRWHEAQLDRTYPPVHFVLLRLSLTLFGENELALRLPAAVMALLSVFFVFTVTICISKSALAGFFAGLVLLTSVLFYTLSRSAHLDMLLIAAATAAYWSYIRAWKDSRYLLVSGLCIGFAYLSKTLMVVFVLGPICMDLLISGRSFLRDRNFYIGSGIALCSAALWHLERTFSTGEIHVPYYGQRLVQQLAGDFSHWDLLQSLFSTEKLSLLLWAIGLIWLVRKFQTERGARFMIYGVLSGCVLLMVVQTVMLRYFLPIIPPMAVGAGCFLGSIKTKYRYGYATLATIVLAAVFLAGNIDNLVNPDFSPGVKMIASSIERRENRSDPVIFFRGYCASFDYYFGGKTRLLTDSKESYERYMAHGAMRSGLGAELLSPPEITRVLARSGIVAVTLVPFDQALREYLFEGAALDEESVFRKSEGAFVYYHNLNTSK